MNMWQKETNFELGGRVPLIMRAPRLPKSVGAVTHALVETVDLLPTFMAVAGLPALPPGQLLQCQLPPGQLLQCQLPPGQLLQGSSLADLLANPNDQANWKPYAFSQFAKAKEQTKQNNPRCWASGTCAFFATTPAAPPRTTSDSA
jgi:arylsulfatase A-like enzyme